MTKKLKYKFKLPIILALIFVMSFGALQTVYAAPTNTYAATYAKKARLSLTLNRTNISINLGKSTTIKATVKSNGKVVNNYVKWQSSNPKIATVDKKGKVTAKKKGTAVITATCLGKKATCRVTVKAIPLQKVKLNQTSVTLFVGKSTVLKSSLVPSNTTDNKKVTWKSSNPQIATIDKNGKLVAKKSGNITITATCGNKKATCSVKVKKPVTKLRVNRANATLSIGEVITLHSQIFPGDCNETVTWSSSSPYIATVNRSGIVTAKKPGTVTITAKAGSFKATCKIVVNNKTYVPDSRFYKWVDTKQCYTLLNNLRKKAGVGTLTYDKTLEKYAKTRAIEIVTKFSHTRPNGQKGINLIKGNLYKGENIARGQRTCAEVTKAWYNSTGHRANMLKKQYKKVAIVAVKHGMRTYWVQLFSS